MALIGWKNRCQGGQLCTGFGPHNSRILSEARYAPFSCLPRRCPAVASCLAPSICCSQEATIPASSNQQATVPRIAGVFIDPIPDAPFSGTVEIISRQKLADGSVYVLKTINFIARDSRGRTRNEARKLVSASYEQEPPITSVHIYDPVSGLDFSVLIPTRLLPNKRCTHRYRMQNPFQFRTQALQIQR